MSHASPALAARADARAARSCRTAIPSPEVPLSPRPLCTTLSAQPEGGARGSTLARVRGATVGGSRGFSSGFSRWSGLSADLPIGFFGSPRPWSPGEGSGPRVWSEQGICGADLYLIVARGGNFLPGEGSLPSPLTFFLSPGLSARGGGSGIFSSFSLLNPGPPGCALDKISGFP